METMFSYGKVECTKDREQNEKKKNNNDHTQQTVDSFEYLKKRTMSEDPLCCVDLHVFMLSVFFSTTCIFHTCHAVLK